MGSDSLAFFKAALLVVDLRPDCLPVAGDLSLALPFAADYLPDLAVAGVFSFGAFF